MRRHCIYTSTTSFIRTISLILAISYLLSIPTLAHSPIIAGNNENLAGATLINDPTKSWAVYGQLHEGKETQYYRFNISKAQRIHISLIKSTNPEERDFTPAFVLMGMEINSRGSVPNFVEVPAGFKALVVVGEQPSQATYEPFSASSFYSLAELDMDAPASGTYYIAVYEPSRGGSYGLAIGERESYSLSEWILIPVSLISLYQWEGQSLAMIFLPIISILLIGLMIWLRQRSTVQTLFELIGFIAGLLFLGSGATFFLQMLMALTRTQPVPEIAITIILAMLPILLGIAAIRVVTKSQGKIDIHRRVYLAILGILALFVWAGLLVGPVLAVLASIMPARAGIKP